MNSNMPEPSVPKHLLSEWNQDRISPRTGDAVQAPADAGEAQHSETNVSSSPGSKMRLTAFAMLLAVPAALTGCGNNYEECDPYVEYCEYNSSGGYYYYNGGSGTYLGSGTPLSKSQSESIRSSSKSKGFGSGGSSGIRSGG